VTYRIVIVPSALKDLRTIKDLRVRRLILDRIDGLAKDPGKQGKPLIGTLSGYRSLRAAGQRYRIIYRIVDERIQILVLSIGLRREGDRRDVYQLFRRLIRLRLIDPE
jgi:mRNA interferase RelE/StbE